MRITSARMTISSRTATRQPGSVVDVDSAFQGADNWTRPGGNWPPLLELMVLEPHSTPGPSAIICYHRLISHMLVFKPREYAGAGAEA